MKGETWSVVVPTLGRPSLRDLLASLAAQEEQPSEVVVVDDRDDGAVLDVSAHPLARVVAGRAAGPAAARNVGWRRTSSDWVVFVDDDVQLPPSWSRGLVEDLARCSEAVGATKAVVRVPLPEDRRPTDWERGTAGLVDAAWITAEMAYRRTALTSVGGFDERFPRAYREDSDLAIRVRQAGFQLEQGTRMVLHPVRPAPLLASLRQQRGNADDALMRALHGPHWRAMAAAGPPGRLPLHALTFTSAAGAVAGLALRHRRAGAVAALAWAVLTGEFFWRRVAPGPGTPREVTAMGLTSVAIPFAAVSHRLVGQLRARRLTRASPTGRSSLAVLFDRDGTLVHDVRYNGDPGRVRPMPGAVEALDRLRSAGLRIGVITNQSAIGRGLVTAAQVDAVNRRVEELLGPFDDWQVCPHTPEDSCACRKPEPGLVQAAARNLGVRPDELVVVGDIAADVVAATAAGSVGILVPNAQTRPEEVRSATMTAPSLGRAVELILDAR
ncbi:MAG: HAD-IIIA family hydrolase [Actinomycetales bacterium]